ncbi:hypothetical protein L9F63_003589, partial [Diploptera punctata]
GYTFYKKQEDIAILKFIFANRTRCKQTGGVKLWRLMERKKVLPGRTWQSMKERYRKVLVNKLDKYLSPEKINKLDIPELKGADHQAKRKKNQMTMTHQKSICSSFQVPKDRIQVDHTSELEATTSFNNHNHNDRNKMNAEKPKSNINPQKRHVYPSKSGINNRMETEATTSFNNHKHKDRSKMNTEKPKSNTNPQKRDVYASKNDVNNRMQTSTLEATTSCNFHSCKDRNKINAEKPKSNVNPPKRDVYSSKSGVNNKMQTNHVLGLKCTCCFDFYSNNDQIEASKQNPIVTTSKTVETIHSLIEVTTNTKDNNMSKESSVSNSHIEVSKNKNDDDVSKESGLYFEVIKYTNNNNVLRESNSKKNQQKQITNRSKRKLFSQRDSSPDLTPVSDEETCFYSVKPHTLFEKKFAGKKHYNKNKKRLVEKSNKSINGMNAESISLLKVSNDTHSTLKTNDNKCLKSQKYTNKTESESEENEQNGKNKNKESHLKASSKVAQNQLLCKQPVVYLIDCRRFKYPMATVPEDMNGRNDNNTSKDKVSELTETRLNNSNNNNKLHKDRIVLGESEEEGEFMSSIFNNSTLLGTGETQKLLGNTFIDKMLDVNEILQTKYVENNINVEPENIQRQGNKSPTVCNSLGIHNIELPALLNENTVEHMKEKSSTSIKEREEDSSLIRNKNSSSNFEEEMENLTVDVLTTSSSSSTLNTSTSTFQIQMEKRTCSSDKQNREIICKEKENLQINHSKNNFESRNMEIENIEQNIFSSNNSFMPNNTQNELEEHTQSPISNVSENSLINSIKKNVIAIINSIQEDNSPIENNESFKECYSVINKEFSPSNFIPPEYSVLNNLNCMHNESSCANDQQRQGSETHNPDHLNEKQPLILEPAVNQNSEIEPVVENCESGIDTADEYLSSTDNSDSENISKTLNNESEIHLAIHDQQENKINKNIHVANTSKEEFHNLVVTNGNHVAHSEECEEINDNSCSNGVGNNNSENCKEAMQCLEDKDTIYKTYVVQNCQNIIRDMSNMVLDIKPQDELSQFCLNNHIQVYFPENFRLVSEFKYEILNIPEENFPIPSVSNSGENSMQNANNLDDKVTPLDIHNGNINNYLPKYSVNEGNENNEDIIESSFSDKKEMLSEVKLEPDVADVEDTKDLKPIIERIEFSDNYNSSYIPYKDLEIKKEEEEIEVDENTHISLHLTDHSYSLEAVSDCETKPSTSFSYDKINKNVKDKHLPTTSVSGEHENVLARLSETPCPENAASNQTVKTYNTSIDHPYSLQESQVSTNFPYDCNISYFNKETNANTKEKSLQTTNGSGEDNNLFLTKLIETSCPEKTGSNQILKTYNISIDHSYSLQESEGISDCEVKPPASFSHDRNIGYFKKEVKMESLDKKSEPDADENELPMLTEDSYSEKNISNQFVKTYNTGSCSLYQDSTTSSSSSYAVRNQTKGMRQQASSRAIRKKKCSICVDCVDEKITNKSKNQVSSGVKNSSAISCHSCCSKKLLSNGDSENECSTPEKMIKRKKMRIFDSDSEVGMEPRIDVVNYKTRLKAT